MKNYLNESATKSSGLTSVNQNTFKKKARRTLGSEEDVDQKMNWNTSAQNLVHFYSPPKSRVEYQNFEALLQQNRKLKEEIKTLRQIVMDSSSICKTSEKLDGTLLRSKKEEKTEEIQKLKKIIEKSYYSIKQMQQQICNLKEQVQCANSNSKMMEKKNKIIEFQKEELETKIISNNLIHRQQIQVLHERIRKLDLLTSQLVDMIEQDQRNWNQHMYELTNLKKFYSNRTYK